MTGTGNEPDISAVCCGLVGTLVADDGLIERSFAEAIATQGVVAGTSAYARRMTQVHQARGQGATGDVFRTLFPDNEARAQAAQLAFDRALTADAIRRVEIRIQPAARRCSPRCSRASCRAAAGDLAVIAVLDEPAAAGQARGPGPGRRRPAEAAASSIDAERPLEEVAEGLSRARSRADRPAADRVAAAVGRRWPGHPQHRRRGANSGRRAGAWHRGFYGVLTGRALGRPAQRRQRLHSSCEKMPTSPFCCRGRRCWPARLPAGVDVLRPCAARAAYLRALARPAAVASNLEQASTYGVSDTSTDRASVRRSPSAAACSRRHGRFSARRLVTAWTAMPARRGWRAGVVGRLGALWWPL